MDTKYWDEIQDHLIRVLKRTEAGKDEKEILFYRRNAYLFHNNLLKEVDMTYEEKACLLLRFTGKFLREFMSFEGIFDWPQWLSDGLAKEEEDEKKH